jgi:hypothetical protein
MALTVTNKLSTPYRIVGNQKEVVRDCAFDSKYAEGGEPLSAATLGLSRIDHIQSAEINAIAGSVNVASTGYDEENEKLQLFNEEPKEVANEADVEGVVVRVVARGY